MQLTINGEARQLPDGATVAAMVEALGLAPSQVAIERNRVIVARSAWASQALQADDSIEIVKFIGGG